MEVLFLATDILNLKYGEKTAKKSIPVGFIAMVLMTIALVYNPSINDFSQESLKTIFTINIRIMIASLIAFSISQFIDTIVFTRLHKKYKKYGWVIMQVRFLSINRYNYILFNYILWNTRF